MICRPGLRDPGVNVLSVLVQSGQFPVGRFTPGIRMCDHCDQISLPHCKYVISGNKGQMMFLASLTIQISLLCVCVCVRERGGARRG